MPRRETLNNHNTAKRMTETFGHSDNLITLSGARLEVTTPLFYARGRPRQYTAFLAFLQVLEQRVQRQTCLHFAESLPMIFTK